MLNSGAVRGGGGGAEVEDGLLPAKSKGEILRGAISKWDDQEAKE